MAFKPGSQDDEILSEINITPIADLFLVLLIIFMVASSAFTQNGVKVDLPKANAPSESTNSDALVISLDKTGDIFVNSKAYSLQELEPILRDLLSKSQAKFVVFEGDTTTQLGRAVEIMDIAKKAGAVELAIATDNPVKKN